MICSFSICLFFNFILITFQTECNWSSWSTTIQCQWIKNNCIHGYQRNCLCNNVVSSGLACSENRRTLQNYIQVKPFVSNRYSPAGHCLKRNCPNYKNWCAWESWSYWNPITNTSCSRHRIRKCCESTPQNGYTILRSPNYGCFISNTQEAFSSSEIESKEMKCSLYTKWYAIAIYIGIGVGCLSILCIICRFTRSSHEKIKSEFSLEEVSRQEINNQNTPTAPIDQSPIVEQGISETLIPTSSFPTTPPSYDESIGFNNFTTIPIPSKVPEKETVDYVKPPSRKNSSENLITNPCVENIPPPTYALYLRNPALFSQNS